MNAEDRDAQKLLGAIDRESGLVLDREGRWHHQGQPVTHERLSAALHKWIDKDEESGRYILRAGEQWCFIEVEGAPYHVRGVVLCGEGRSLDVTLRLSDGSEEPLTYSTLVQHSDNSLWCEVKGGRFQARFDRAAYYALAEHVEFQGDEPYLPAGGDLWPIRNAPTD